MSESEVARILAQIEQEYQASKRGLEGFASGTARHDFISAKTQNIEKCHEQFVELVGPEKAITIIANTIWKPLDQCGSSHNEGGLERCGSRCII